MKNDLENIDKLFKKGLKDSRLEPSPRLWAGIEKALPVKTAFWRKFSFKLFIGIVSLGVAIGAFFYISKKDDVKKQIASAKTYNAEKQIVEKKTNTDKKIEPANSLPAQSKENLTSSENSKLTKKASEITLAKPSNEGNRLPEQNKNASIKESKKQEVTTENKRAINNNKAENKVNQTKEKISSNNKLKDKSKKAKTLLVGIGNDENKKHGKENISGSNIPKTPINASPSEKLGHPKKIADKSAVLETSIQQNIKPEEIPNVKTTSNSNLKSEEKWNTTFDTNQNKNIIQKGDITPINDKKDDSIPALVPNITGNGSVKTTSKAKRDLNLSVEAFVSPFASYIYLTGNSAMQSYIDTRSKSEVTSFSYQAGIEAKYNIKRFFIKSGINVSDYKSKANYTINKITKIDTSSKAYKYDTISKVFDTAWPSHWIYKVDSGWVYKIDTLKSTKNYTSNISLQYIEIPLLFGYEFGKGKLRIRPSIGMSVAFLMSSKGQILALDQSDVIDFNRRNMPFNASIFNFLFRFGLTYKLTNKITFILEESSKQNLSSIFKSSYPIDQRYKAYGINLGISYKF